MMIYIQDPSEWYYVSIRQFLKYGGNLLKYYNGSLLQALQAIYPDQEWRAWRFSSRSPHHSSKKYSKMRSSKTQHLLYQLIQKVSKNNSLDPPNKIINLLQINQ